jgi:hypothetical protein
MHQFLAALLISAVFSGLWPSSMAAGQLDSVQRPGATLASFSSPHKQSTDGELASGTTAQVQGTDGAGVRVRATPITSATVRTVLLDGTQVQVLNRQLSGDGAVWYRIRYDEQDSTGWVVGQFLAAAEQRAAPATQAQPVIQPTLPIGTTWDDAFALLLDPCRSLQVALLHSSINPTIERMNPFWSTMTRTAWPLLLPVLHQIAVRPALDHDPRTVRRLINEQVSRARANESVLFTHLEADQAMQDIEDAAARGLTALARGDRTVEPGLVLLAAMWSDADRRAAWRMVASGAQGGVVGDAMMMAALRQGWARDGEIGNIFTVEDYERVTRC